MAFKVTIYVFRKKKYIYMYIEKENKKAEFRNSAQNHILKYK